MEQIRRGEVWIVELLAHPKPRPAIVASIDPINDLCPDVILTYPCYDEASPFKNSFVRRRISYRTETKKLCKMRIHWPDS